MSDRTTHLLVLALGVWLLAGMITAAVAVSWEPAADHVYFNRPPQAGSGARPQD